MYLSLTAEGKGNDDISIQCRGTMKITRVFAFGIVGDTKTVTDFDKYCQANIKDVDNTKVCIISLKRVYKTNYPPFISTKVTYKCTYVTRDKAEPAWQDFCDNEREDSSTWETIFIIVTRKLFEWVYSALVVAIKIW
jgi:hypothetical protein